MNSSITQLRWRRLNSLSETVPNVAAAYRIRYKQRRIARHAGVDPLGILSIGKAPSGLRDRMSQFQRAFRAAVAGVPKPRLHSEGTFLGLLAIRSRIGPLSIENLVVEYVVVSDQLTATECHERCTQIEKTLLAAYVKRYGELPPLNRKLDGGFTSLL